MLLKRGNWYWFQSKGCLLVLLSSHCLLLRPNGLRERTESRGRKRILWVDVSKESLRQLLPKNCYRRIGREFPSVTLLSPVQTSLETHGQNHCLVYASYTLLCLLFQNLHTLYFTACCSCVLLFFTSVLRLKILTLRSILETRELNWGIEVDETPTEF